MCKCVYVNVLVFEIFTFSNTVTLKSGSLKGHSRSPFDRSHTTSRVATSSNEKSGTLGVWGLSPQLGHGQSSWWGLGGQSRPLPPKTGVWGRAPRS